jgi:hypothetical protein
MAKSRSQKQARGMTEEARKAVVCGLEQFLLCSTGDAFWRKTHISTNESTVELRRFKRAVKIWNHRRSHQSNRSIYKEEEAYVRSSVQDVFRKWCLGGYEEEHITFVRYERLLLRITILKFFVFEQKAREADDQKWCWRHLHQLRERCKTVYTPTTSRIMNKQKPLLFAVPLVGIANSKLVNRVNWNAMTYTTPRSH